jgi:DNA helicase-2/ATP-dependent DNA helicase PcrA
VKVQHLSASRIKTFKQCQLKYHATYDLGMTSEPHELTLMGLAVHKACEISTKARRLGRHENLWNPVDLIDSAMAKYRVKSYLRDLTEELINNAMEWGYFRKVEEVIGEEIEFNEELPNGMKVKGFIDRLDKCGDGLDIKDLKTQKRKFTDDELDDNWQAHIYNLAVRRLYPEVTGDVTVSFWVLRHQVQKVTLTLEDAKRTEERLVEVGEEIQSITEPTASPSGLCPWCPYHSKCDAPNEGIKARMRRKKYGKKSR